MINYIYQIDGKGPKLARPVTSKEEYFALRNAPDNAKNFYDARGGDETAKAAQIQFNYNDLLPDGGLRGGNHPSSTFAHDIDCGDAQEQMRLKDEILAKKDEIGLLELSGSARYGLHAVCRRQPGRTVRECQYALSMATHTEYDTNAKDLTRVMYTGPATEDNLFYLDDAIFEEPMTVEESEKEYQVLKEREKKKLEEVPKGAKKANKHYRPWEDEGSQADEGRTQGTGTSVTSQATTQMSQSPCATGAEERIPKFPDSVDTKNSSEIIEASERTRYVFRECMKEEDVTEADLVNEGGRHNSVKVVLSHCNQLLSEGETLGVLKELMPNNWNDENIRTLVKAYYTDYYNQNQRLTVFQKRVFKESKRMGIEGLGDTHGVRHFSDIASDITEMPDPSVSPLSRLFASKEPPKIPEVLPKLVKVVTQSTPKKFIATVAQAMFPPLATYPKKLSFVYVDNQVRELRINCLIVAGTGTGKDMCTKQPLTHIITDMKERDEQNRNRLKKYNEECNRKANNKQNPPRPTDLVIQVIKSNITYAALVQRMDEAQGAPLYVRLNELEQWDKIEGCTGRSNQFTNLKLCDDEGNDFGADRASTQSVMGSGCLHLNWNANTTLSKVVRYFRFVLTDGPISRLCLATIPEDEIGGDIPVFGEYGNEYDEALKPYINNLKNATGVIDCPEARKLIKKLKNECADFARLSQDSVFDNLSHRALVHVFRKACLLFAANGMKWEKAIEGFCRWSLFYDLYLKMMLFGDLIRQADGDVSTSKRGPQSLLELLPDEFTIEDAANVRRKMGMEAGQARHMITVWMNRHHVYQISDISFKKANKLKKKDNE